jgi:hypothetical protein
MVPPRRPRRCRAASATRFAVAPILVAPLLGDAGELPLDLNLARACARLWGLW